MESNVEVNNVVKKKFFTPIRIVVVVVIVIAIIVGGGIIYSKQKALNAEKTYMKNLDTVMLMFGSQGGNCETDAQEIASVWHDAIYNSSVTVNGKVATTFDDAIQYKLEEFKEDGKMDDLVKYKAKIQTLMETLSNPPIKDKDAYDLVMKVYDSYTEFENMVENPSGSLSDYNQKFSTIDDSISSQMGEFRTRYPLSKQ